jgi:SAM-dependent methyltransferase
VTRREKLLSGLDVAQLRGIEIGPLASPVIRKQESEVYYVDHADQATLRAKYAHDANVDTQKIVPIDAIWGDHTLRECFPDGSLFDYVIASHVLEHVPDMLGWLREIAEILRPGGRLMLAIPDRRFTFDYLRLPTRFSEVLDAYLRGNRRPMPAQIFDFNVNAVDLNVVAAWNGGIDPASLKRFVNSRFAFDLSLAAVRDGKYIDGHCWVFTASSFATLLADAIDLDLLPYACVAMYEPERNHDEFIVILERWSEESASQKEAARASFLRQASWELQTESAPQALEAATAEIATLRNRVQTLESDLAALLSSRSFRITRPLRKLGGLARRFKLFVSPRRLS